MVSFNLDNREFFGINLKNYFSNQFKKIGYSYTKKDAFISHYSNAQIIGFGFPKSYFEKKEVHLLFKNDIFYPRGIIINNSFLQENKNLVEIFIDNKRKILKKDKGISSEFIYLVNNFEQVKKIVNSTDYYVLQEEIMPLLHLGKKMDERCYIFVVKENDTFTSYFLPYYYLKFTRNNFRTDGLDKDSFITNIKPPNKKLESETIPTLNFIDEFAYHKKDSWLKQRNDVIKKISDKILPIIAENTSEYYSKRFEPQFLLNIYGIDLLIDDKYKIYLCEINYKTGLPVFYDKKTGKNEIDYRVLNEINEHFFKRWLNEGTTQKPFPFTKIGEVKRKSY